MSYYNVCPYCEGNLDPGEKCDCRKKLEQETKKAAAFPSSGRHPVRISVGART